MRLERFTSNLRFFENFAKVIVILFMPLFGSTSIMAQNEASFRFLRS